MKIKVLKTTKTTKDGRTFTSYFTPVMIVVKGEEDKGEQQKGLTLNFSKEADKKLPVNFNGGILECKGEDVIMPFVYEIKQRDGKDDYPNVYIKDFEKITPLKPKKNTCRFLVDEEESEETEL